MRSVVDDLHRQNRSIGLVPTMGALHDGHLLLIESAREISDFVVCSIFVNPAQFNSPSDLEKYPRDHESDCHKLAKAHCDAVFLPKASEMYSGSEASMGMNFGRLESVMEGKFRPGHFSGVGVVVAKFFNIIQPKLAFFGKKDLQQLAIIKKLVSDLKFPVEIIPVETKREKSGLAMSSRNALLSENEKEDAVFLINSLKKLKKSIKSGGDIEFAKQEIMSDFTKRKNIDLEYIEVVEADSMISATSFEPNHEYAICCAAVVHGVRLIDNISL